MFGFHSVMWYQHNTRKDRNVGINTTVSSKEGQNLSSNIISKKKICVFTSNLIMHCLIFKLQTLINRLTFVGHFRLSNVVINSAMNTQLPRATEQAVYKAQYTHQPDRIKSN